MDGHPPSVPPDERALSPPVEGLAERSATPLLRLVAPGDFPRLPVPSEAELDKRQSGDAPSSLFPNLSVDEESADALMASRERAWVQVRLGATALPVVLAELERNLRGRRPQILTSREALDLYFAVGDYSDHAWRKVAEVAWAVGTLLGGSRQAVTELRIQLTDLSPYLDTIPPEYRQPEDFGSHWTRRCASRGGDVCSRHDDTWSDR